MQGNRHVDPGAGRNRRRRAALLAGAGLAAMAAYSPAAAQTGRESAARDEIVVTARQREENLQDVPISISALGGEALRAARIDRLQEIEHSVPNLVFGESGSSGETHVGMRGIGDFSRNIGFDTRVGVYIDGVFAGQSLAVDQGLSDIAQVEVLRGPQGTLFGKNSSSGVINIVTRKPQLGAAEGEATFGAGNFSGYYGSAALNLPLGETAAARFSFVGRTQDGYVENLATGDNLMTDNHLAGRGQLRFQPNDALDVVVSGDIRRQHNDILFLEPEPDVFAPARLSVSQDGPLIDENDSWGVALSADYRLADGHVLTSITGYRNAKRRVGSDEDGSPGYGLHVAYFNDEFRHFTQELRLASPSSQAFRYVIGGFFFNQKGEQARDAFFGPAFGAPADTLAATGAASVDTTSWAAFVNANLDLTGSVSVNGGVRYTHERKEALISQTGSPAGLADFVDYSDSFSEGDVTATASLQYRASRRALAYASYARGHKSGGFNVDYVSDPSFIPFDSESVDSFEIGLKSDLIDNRLRLNIAAFHARYHDFQVFQFQSVGMTTLLVASNAASVRTRGVEIETEIRFADGLKLTYGVGYADAGFVDFPGGATDDLGAPVNIAGNALPRAPKVTAGGMLRYDFALGAAADGAFTVSHGYRGEQFFNPDNRERTRDDGYHLVNLSLDIDIGRHWGVGVWARNVTDATYRTNRGVSFLGIPFSLYGQPRTFGGEIRARF